jgi:hypothetical protein
MPLPAANSRVADGAPATRSSLMSAVLTGLTKNSYVSTGSETHARGDQSRRCFHRHCVVVRFPDLSEFAYKQKRLY